MQPTTMKTILSVCLASAVCAFIVVAGPLDPGTGGSFKASAELGALGRYKSLRDARARQVATSRRCAARSVASGR
jgi:hypothetical protein